MKTNAPALLPILRSDAVGAILAHVFVTPGRRWTLGELAAVAEIPLPTATREVTRMVTAGLLREERVGRTRQIRANSASRLYEPMRQLVLLTYGPLPVLEAMLGGVRGIQEAYIYGSWAARYSGVEGAEPNDIDVLVVGDADPEELFEAGEQARMQLHRDVNIRSVAPASWADPQPVDPFLQHVHANPLVALDAGGPQ